MLKPVKCSGLVFSEACLLEEYYFLFGIAALYRPAQILEIGSNTGLGSLALWSGAHSANSRSVNITTIERNPALIPYIKGNWEAQQAPLKYLHILNGDSTELVPTLCEAGRKFDLCFIDGDHSYAGACTDWNNTQGMTGVWLLHDSSQMPGVRRLVRQIRATGKYNVFGFDEYPFGTQWNSKTNSYATKKSIPGITIVTLKGEHYPVAPEEQVYLDTVRAVESTEDEIPLKL